MSNDQDSRATVLQDVLRRSAVDSDFRRGLLADPHGAIDAAYPGAIPTGLRVQFVERPAQIDALYVLPEASRVSAELSDAELEAVAGGDEVAACPWTCIDIITCASESTSSV